MGVDKGDHEVQLVRGEQAVRLPIALQGSSQSVCCSVSVPATLEAAGGEDGVSAMGKGGDHLL